MCRTVQKIRGSWNLWKHDEAYFQWATNYLMVTDRRNMASYMSWPLLSLVRSLPVSHIRGTLILTPSLQSEKASFSLLPTTATVSAFSNEERKNKEGDRACCNHSSFTGGNQYFLAGPLRLFLASAYCSRAASQLSPERWLFGERHQDLMIPWKPRLKWQKMHLKSSNPQCTMICGMWAPNPTGLNEDNH